MCLQKLRFSPAFYDDLPDFYRDAALLHLSGMLCVNFSPLWDPVIEIIASFAQSSNVKHFWGIFSELLDTAAGKTGNKQVIIRVHVQYIKFPLFISLWTGSLMRKL